MLKLRAVPIGTVLNLRTTTSHSRLESNKEEEEDLVGADGRGEEGSKGLLLLGRHGFVCTISHLYEAPRLFVHRLCATTDHSENSQTESCTDRNKKTKKNLMGADGRSEEGAKGLPLLGCEPLDQRLNSLGNLLPSLLLLSDTQSL